MLVRQRATPDMPAVAVLFASGKCGACDQREAGVCDSLPDAALPRLHDAATALTLRPGQRFIEEGDAAEHFFTLTGGTARLMKLLPNGRQQITSFPGTGDFLGLAVGERYSYAAEAVDRVRLCRFPRGALRRLMAEYPQMAHRLLDYTAHELVLAQEQMLLLGRKTAIERVASFLLARARRSDLGTQGSFVLPMTRADIADYLGLRLETASRTLSALKRSGVIGIVAGSLIIVRDRSALEDLAFCR